MKATARHDANRSGARAAVFDVMTMQNVPDESLDLGFVASLLLTNQGNFYRSLNLIGP